MISILLSLAGQHLKFYSVATSNIPIFLPPANEVWGKVIFLHLFVILFMGGVLGPGGYLPWGGACSGGCLFLRGGCLVQRAGGGCACSLGVSGLGGIPAPGGGWVPAPGGGGCLVETPPRRLLLRAVCILLECILVK